MRIVTYCSIDRVLYVDIQKLRPPLQLGEEGTLFPEMCSGGGWWLMVTIAYLCRVPPTHFSPQRGKLQPGQRKAGPLGRVRGGWWHLPSPLPPLHFPEALQAHRQGVRSWPHCCCLIPEHQLQGLDIPGGHQEPPHRGGVLHLHIPLSR